MLALLVIEQPNGLASSDCRWYQQASARATDEIVQELIWELMPAAPEPTSANKSSKS